VESLEVRTLFATAPANVVLTAAADAYVRDGSYAARNAGADPNLVAVKAAAGFNLESHLRFDLAAAPAGNVGRAVVRLYGAFGGASAGGRMPVAVSAAAAATWGESTITWQNRPATAGPVLATTPVGAYGWYEWDVTPHVAAARAAGKPSVGLVVQATTGDAKQVLFSSKEGSALRPQLVLTMGGSATSPPVVVSPPASPPGSQPPLATPARPAQPVGLTATVSGSQIALSWQPVQGATSYVVSRVAVVGQLPAGPLVRIKSGLSHDHLPGPRHHGWDGVPVRRVGRQPGGRGPAVGGGDRPDGGGQSGRR
jgi:hypothetical protein